MTKGEPGYGLVFMEVGNIYTDSCPSVQLDPPVGPTVDDLVSAWGDLPGFDATVPTDTTVDGFDGKQIEFTVPDYDEDDCAYGQFMLLGGVDDPPTATGPKHPTASPTADPRRRRHPARDRRLVPGHLGAGPGRHRRDPQLHPDRLNGDRS